MPENLNDLFLLFAQSDLLNYTFAIANNDSNILYKSDELSDLTIKIIQNLIINDKDDKDEYEDLDFK